MIEDKICQDIHREELRGRQKYMWLARYHNRCIQKFTEWRDIGMSKFEIAEKLLRFYKSFSCSESKGSSGMVFAALPSVF
jgi:hypothetical protein